MDSPFAETIYGCYCQKEVVGSSLLAHFDSCTAHLSSDLHSIISPLLQPHIGSSLSYFLSMQLLWEAQQLLKPPPPVISCSFRFRRCETCKRTNLEGGKVYEDCRHSFCKDHVPPHLCSTCHPEAQFTVSCSQCGLSTDQMITLACSHVLCHSHIKEVFAEIVPKTGKLDCFLCGTAMLHTELRTVMGEQAVEAALLQSAIPEGWKIVTCPQCKVTGALEPGEVDYSLKDISGRVYTRQAAVIYSKYRFRCQRCNVSVCANCQASPFHDALTCDQRAALALGACRYCEEQPPDHEDCCDIRECRLELEGSCKKKLPCGHRCYGVNREQTCPPCLVEGCVGDLRTTENEYCCYCGSYKLKNKPVVELECGHFVHHQCLKDTLHRRWPGARITFKFCKCPLCQDWAVAKYNTELQREIGKYQLLFEQIKRKGFERLRIEPEENKRINDPHDSAYYNQPEKYILDRFCFYECHRCHESYFGGKKECEDNADRGNDPGELLCPTCTLRNTGQSEGKICPTHGINFIEYKCRYCCSVATFYCWGTTHFCEECHRRHNSGDYLTDKTLSELPQCKGPDTCPLKTAHLPNGKEFILGCSLCRSGLK